MNKPWSTLSVDWLTAHRINPGPGVPTDADGVEWVLTDLTGWVGSPGVRSARSARPLGRHGSYRGRSSRTERVLGVEVTMTAPDEAMVPGISERAEALCSNSESPYVLTVDDPVIGPRSADVDLDDAVLVKWRTPESQIISYQFAAPDPCKHGPWITYETPLSEPPVGGLDFTSPGLNFTSPGLNFGTPGSPGTVAVPNPGTADASPVLELVGPLPDAQVICMETGVRANFGQPIEAGHSMWINCDEFPALGLPGLSVLLDAQSDRRRWWMVPQGWPLIPAGGSVTFALRSSSYDPAARLRVVSRSAWW